MLELLSKLLMFEKFSWQFEHSICSSFKEVLSIIFNISCLSSIEMVAGLKSSVINASISIKINYKNIYFKKYIKKY